MPNQQSAVGKVTHLTIRECANEINIHPQTFKNWLLSNRHNLAVLLEPTRVGHDAGQLIIPIGLWDDFLVNDWPRIREGMKRGRGRKPRGSGE